MKLFEYLIGGKKMGRPLTVESFRDIKPGTNIWLWNFDHKKLKRREALTVGTIPEIKDNNFTFMVQKDGKKYSNPTVPQRDLDKNFTAWESNKGTLCAFSLEDYEPSEVYEKIVNYLAGY